MFLFYKDWYINCVDLNIIFYTLYIILGTITMVKRIKSASILVIDDDIDMVKAYTAILKKNDFKVCSSMNSSEGLGMIDKFNPDLIILDIMMENPDSGFLFLNELKERNINVPVILSSSIAKATSNILDVSQLNIKTILQKPVDFDELMVNIKKYT